VVARKGVRSAETGCVCHSANLRGVSVSLARSKPQGRVVEGDVRRAATLLRPYRERVKLVITSPPYLDITDYHEDQWLRLWFLGGAAKPVTGQGKDDRHRRIDAYWQFLRDAWKGVYRSSRRRRR